MAENEDAGVIAGRGAPPPVGLQSYRSAVLEVAGVLELRAKLVAVSSVPVGAAYTTAAQIIRDAVELVDNAHDQQQVLEGRANG